MAELSRNQLRNPGADRRQRRNSLIPDRRDTDAPVRRASNDIRSGTRGDVGGAEALMQMARQINGAANSFVERGEAKYKRDESLNAIQGQQDLEAGSIDPEKLRKSFAYRATVTTGQAKTALSTLRSSTVDGLKQYINNTQSTNIEEVEKDIDAFIDMKKKELIYNKDGKLNDFGSPEAARVLFDGMQKMTEELKTAARKDFSNALKERTKNALGESMSVDLEMGLPVNLEERIASVPKGVDMGPGEIRDILYESALNAATAAEMNGDFDRAQQIRYELLNATRKVKKAEALPALVSDGGGVVAGAATGKLPVDGKVTNNFEQHKARGSMGVDIDGKIGDAVLSPASGTVSKVGYDPKSGYFVIVDHGGGVVSTYSHLNRQLVTEGQQIGAGVQIAEVGNSGRVKRGKGGDGSHLHYRVKVNGKDVDPLKHTFSAPVSQTTGPGGTPLIDAMMASTETEGEAPVTGGPRLVPILSGTVYSLSGQQRAQVLAAIEAGDVQREREADKAEQERFEQGSEEVTQMFLDGKPPSKAQLAQWSREGRIHPTYAMSMVNAIEADERYAKSEARAAQNEAEREWEIAGSTAVAYIATEWKAGLGPRNYNDFMKELGKLEREGKLGPPSMRAGVVSGLDSAWRQGRTTVTKSPDYKVYAGQITQMFSGKGIAGALGGSDPSLKAAALTEYGVAIDQGKSPAVAFAEVKAKYEKSMGNPSKRISDVDARLSELEKKR